MRILGIETSHDDTSVCVWEDYKVIKLITISQIDIFKEFGGTIPELASREHVKNIQYLLQILLKNNLLDDLDYVAYTKEPGLIGALQVGELFAHAISLAIDKPIIPINHMLGHFYSVNIEDSKILYPCLSLVVSGGHSEIILSDYPGDYQIIGQTQDDALGEAFDKIATKLNLGFPGGPIIDKIFNNNLEINYINFTRPKTENELDFSFSGLKTQVINYANKTINSTKCIENLEKNKEIIASSFMKTSVEYTIDKFRKALSLYSLNSIVLCGGVSANSYLRKLFEQLHKNALVPNKKYCQDNGAMIATCAYEMLKHKGEKLWN